MPSDSSDSNVLNNRNIDENHPLAEKKILEFILFILKLNVIDTFFRSLLHKQ